jgi:hypothetical protein
VLHQQDPDSGVGDGPEQLTQCLHFGRAQAGRRLVQHDEPGLESQRACHLHQTLDAVRRLPRDLVVPAVQAEHSQGGDRGLVRGPFCPASRRQPQDRGGIPAPDCPVGGDQDVEQQ